MEIEQTLSTHTKDSGIPLIVATDVERFVKSPITYWCNIHAPEEHRDPLPPYLKHLFEIGQDYQADVIDESYTGAVQKIFFDEEVGFRFTLELMTAGEHAIQNMPIMCRPMGLEGRTDVLVRVDDAASDLGFYSYAVVEIKTSRNIQKGHILQAAVYNRLVGEIQGYEPREFYIINRDGDVMTVQMAEVNDELDQVLSDMRDIMNGKMVVEPCHGSAEWPWETYVNHLAIEASDVSLVPGVGVATREGLIDEGFRTVETVANARLDQLTKVRRVGAATAKKFVSAAQAIHGGDPVRRDGSLQLPTASTQVFFDFEGTDPRIGADGLEVVNYLIGALVRHSLEPATFVSFFAESLDDEERVLKEFLAWGSSLDDAVFFHWHHYERTHLTKMTDFYEISPADADPVMGRLLDLHPITTKAFAFPAYGEGLKDIAKCLGFNWRHGDVDALTSVALYFQYLDSNGKNQEDRQKILDYNEDDCLATMHIFDWLSSQ